MLTESELRERARPIRLLLMDVDGVLADGGIIVDSHGEETKRFHVRDGFGIRSWLRVGHHAAILSGRYSRPVAWRARELGVHPVIQGQTDKTSVFRELLRQMELSPSEVCYIGDDLPDLPLILTCGLGATVCDAPPVVRECADWISTTPGGQGAVRELVEFLLDAQGRWDEVIAHYRRPVQL